MANGSRKPEFGVLLGAVHAHIDQFPVNVPISML